MKAKRTRIGMVGLLLGITALSVTALAHPFARVEQIMRRVAMTLTGTGGNCTFNGDCIVGDNCEWVCPGASCNGVTSPTCCLPPQATGCVSQNACCQETSQQISCQGVSPNTVCCAPSADPINNPTCPATPSLCTTDSDCCSATVMGFTSGADAVHCATTWDTSPCSYAAGTVAFCVGCHKDLDTLTSPSGGSAFQCCSQTSQAAGMNQVQCCEPLGAACTAGPPSTCCSQTTVATTPPSQANMDCRAGLCCVASGQPCGANSDCCSGTCDGTHHCTACNY